MYFGYMLLACLITAEETRKNCEIKAFLKCFLSMFLKQITIVNHRH